MNWEFKLPDVGEGLADGEIVRWHVTEGQQISEGTPLVSILTDKAEVEIPSPKTGTIHKLMAGVGQRIKVHENLVIFELPQPAAPSAPAARPAPHDAATRSPTLPVGAPAFGAAADIQVLPAVRKLAAQLGVDLSKIKGTGPVGRITEADVLQQSSPRLPAPGVPAAKTPAEDKTVVMGAIAPVKPPSPPPPAPAPKPEPAAVAAQGSPSPEGAETRVPFTGIRRRTAEKMAASWRTIPHVTHVDEADVTALAALRGELRGEAERKGTKLTTLPFILRALAKTLPEYPDFNASLDEEGGAIVRKHALNVGIATQAQQGLVVPVIKDCVAKDLWSLASAVGALAEKVRANKVSVAELQGGTFTVTNIGPLGGLWATPIINHPEVAILAVMKIQKRPVVIDGGLHVRDRLPLALSFDHRVIDGAQAAHFMNTLIKHLENPRTLL